MLHSIAVNNQNFSICIKCSYWSIHVLSNMRGISLFLGVLSFSWYNRLPRSVPFENTNFRLNAFKKVASPYTTNSGRKFPHYRMLHGRQLKNVRYVLHNVGHVKFIACHFKKTIMGPQPILHHLYRRVLYGLIIRICATGSHCIRHYRFIPLVIITPLTYTELYTYTCNTGIYIE